MARSRTTQLTPAHTRILQAIVRLIQSEKPLTVGELVSELGLAGDTSLTPTLKIMQRNGFLHIYGGGERGRRRLVALTPRGKVAAGLRGLPVLGSIPAGPLAEVLEQCETIVEDGALLSHQVGDFLLVVQGDSMIGDGILSGDKVLLRPDVEVQQGEIAAVHIGEDFLATLKHVHFGPGHNEITLKASNPAYKDVVMEAQDVRVVGVYRGLVRGA